MRTDRTGDTIGVVSILADGSQQGGTRVITPFLRSSAQSHEVGRMVAELARFWLTSLERMNWRQRMELLQVIGEEVEQGYPDRAMARQITRKLVRRLIERCGSGVVASRDQAFVYLNSDLDEHRQAGYAWLVLHAPDRLPDRLQDSPAATSPAVGTDLRNSQRYSVRLAVAIAAGGHRMSGELVNLSNSGARIALQAGPADGDRSAVDAMMTLPYGQPVGVAMAYLDPMQAQIVWASPRLAGVNFDGKPISGGSC